MKQLNRSKQDTIIQAGKEFPPGKLFAIDEARAHMVSARGNFTGRGVDAILDETKDTKAILSGLLIAISAWRCIEKTSQKRSAEILEARLALGELYYLRGLVYKERYSQLAITGSNPLHWFVRAGIAFENAICFWGKAVKSNACQPGFDLPSIMKNLYMGHDSAAFSFHYASDYLYRHKVGALFTPVKTLIAQGGDISKYGEKAEAHRQESNRFFMLANPI